MKDTELARKELQDAMAFLGAITSGMEKFIGRAANGLAFVAGKNLGKKYSQNTPKTDNILEAIEITKEILEKNHFLWQLEPWKKKDDVDFVITDDNGGRVIRLVFRDCMIRQTLFRYGHHQQGSLCYMMYGFFSGVTESILGVKSKLNIIHSGPNACLKELILEDAK